MVNVQIHTSPAQVAHAAAEHVVTLAAAAIEARGVFTIGLSGGSTPRALFDLLASAAYSPRMDWANVIVFWGDERCVPPNHAASNYRMARETLLDHVPVPEDQIHRILGELEPPQTAQAYEDLLQEFFAVHGMPRFDLLLQGMGADGHTASLFPGTTALNVTDRWAIENYVPDLDTWRVTLTAPAINAAANIAFLVTGENKASALAEVLHGERDPDSYPAQLIQPIDGNLIWLVDEDAAGNT